MPTTLNNRVLVTMDREGGYTLPDDVSESDIDQKFLVGGKRAIERYFETNDLPTSMVIVRIDGSYGCDVRVSDADLHLDRYRRIARKDMLGATAHLYVLKSSDMRIPSGIEEAGFITFD